MRIDIIAGALPPRFDAIGQYTSKLAEQLARHPDTHVRILTLRVDARTPEGKQSPGEYTPIPGVEIVGVFGVDPPGEVRALQPVIDADPPDWLLLQYNPFHFGRRGLNLDLPSVIRTVRRRHPKMHVATMFHEMFVPIIDLRFAVMATYQRPQTWMIGGASDVVFISTEKWVRQYANWFPGKPPVIHLPVCSNIDRVEIDYASARARLAVTPDTRLLGLFGALHASRMTEVVRDTLQAARRELGSSIRLLHVGPDGPATRDVLKTAECDDDTVIFTEAPLPGDEVSRRIAAMDVILAPFVDGISTRRGSMMTGIQHGIATVGTTGINTDQIFRDAADQGPLLVDVKDVPGFQSTAIALLRDDARRRAVGESGERLYNENFTPERTAARTLEVFAEVAARKR